MAQRIVIKLGSKVVAGGGFAGMVGVDGEGVLGRLCGAVAEEHAGGAELAIVTSGAIARGMGVLGMDRRPGAIDELQAASAVGQGRLYGTYEELLRGHGVRSAQVLLTFMDMAERSNYLNARQALRKLWEWRVVPVINENDTTATDEISFGDNDFLAAQVAILLGADLLVLLTDVDGLFTADPRRDPEARLVGVVEDFGSLAGVEVGEASTPLGTGGMRSKVLAAEMATGAGVRTVICNGVAEGVLRRALAGERVGTGFPARRARESAFKVWLRYAKPSRGAVVVDAGAARALTNAGTSLLPVGIVEVRGEFSAGDAVEILAGGRKLGKGVSSYSAEELRTVMGMQSAQVRELLQGAVDEAVHRDRMVIEEEGLSLA